MVGDTEERRILWAIKECFIRRLLTGYCTPCTHWLIHKFQNVWTRTSVHYPLDRMKMCWDGMQKSFARALPQIYSITCV